MKKVFAVLLAMMLFVLPLSGMAADVEGFGLDTLESGKELIITSKLEVAPGLLDDGIVDLINILGEEIHILGLNAGVELSLSGTTILNLMAGVGDDAILAATNLLGDKAVAVTYEELETVCNEMLNSLMEQFGMTLDDLVALLNELLDTVEGLFTEENLTLIAAYVENVSNVILAKAEMTEDGAVRIVLEPADFRAIVTDDNLMTLLAGIAGEEEAAAVKEEIAASLTDDCGLLVTVEFAETETGVSLFAQVAVGEEGIDFVADVEMADSLGLTASLTGGNLNVPDWSLDFVAAVTDELVYQGNLCVNDGESMIPVVTFDGNVQENLTAFSIYVEGLGGVSIQDIVTAVAENADEETLTVLVEIPEMGTIEAAVIIDTEVNADNAVCAVTLEFAGMTLGTETVTLTAAEDTGFFAPLENEAIYPLEMAAEELEALVATVEENAMGLLIDAMSLLPESTQALLMAE